eukprot:9665937-Alexandrium_andersonii.AAC.1
MAVLSRGRCCSGGASCTTSNVRSGRRQLHHTYTCIVRHLQPLADSAWKCLELACSCLRLPTQVQFGFREESAAYYTCIV